MSDTATALPERKKRLTSQNVCAIVEAGGDKPLASDLRPAAVKAAKRLDCLPNERTYIIVLTKRRDYWELAIQNEDGGKIEHIGN